MDQKQAVAADYWVSQNRKYCDFCKCWITDNKPSIDFHEKGRRHQENVKKKLRNITKASNHSHRETTKVDSALKQMEIAAMEAYRKDMEQQDDLTALAIKQKVQEGLSTKLWRETKSRDGQTHYVNFMTKEIVHKPPAEGYLSLAEQRDLAENETRKQLKALESFKRKEALLNMQETRQLEAEEKSRIAREKLKERRVVDDIPVVSCGPLIEPGKTDPYGKWQTVRESPAVDFQLPEQPRYVEAPVEYEPEPVVREFKEKVVQSLETEEVGDIGFKKRKIGNGAKRNTRQRLDVD